MTESLQLQGQPLRLRLTSHQKSFAMTSKAVRVRSSALYFVAICRTIVAGADSRQARRGPCTPTAACAGRRGVVDLLEPVPRRPDLHGGGTPRSLHILP
jgi:hypothetical protein